VLGRELRRLLVEFISTSKAIAIKRKGERVILSGIHIATNANKVSGN
jgi:hypothetical protein